MSNKDDPQNPLQPPQRFPKTRLARAAAKAAGGAVPIVGSTLTEAADAFLPNPEARDRERWEGEITDGVNTLGGRVEELDQRTGSRLLTLTGGAAAVAKFMVERCPDGLAHDEVTITELEAAYPDLSRDELLDGAGYLESLNLIRSISFIGAPDEYRLTQSGYEALDPPIMGWSPLEDARAIAALVVEKRSDIRVNDIEEKLGWQRRRLNPALRIVVGFIAPGRVSQVIQPDYVTRYFSPNNAELALLRRFAAGE